MMYHYLAWKNTETNEFIYPPVGGFYFFVLPILPLGLSGYVCLARGETDPRVYDGNRVGDSVGETSPPSVRL